MGIVENMGMKYMKIKMHYLEFLRILAILLVVFNHTGDKGFFLFSIKQESEFYWIYLFASIFCKVAVPLFLMISGALLIPKDEDICTLYKIRILRIVLVIIIFNFIQYYYLIFKTGITFDIFEYIRMNFHGYSSAWAYWYLYAYLGLLIMLPMIRKMAKSLSEKEFIYYIGCRFFLAGIVPFFQFIVWKGTLVINNAFDKALIIEIVIFFFIMGHYWGNVVDITSLKRKTINNAILGSIISILACCLITYYKAQITGVCNEAESQTFYFSLILVPTFTIFCLVKIGFTKYELSHRAKRVLVYIGNLTFGIMLVENIIREETIFIFDMLQPHLGNMLSSCIHVLAICIIGGVITIILKMIPLIKKII